jgi:hypothetical protein
MAGEPEKYNLLCPILIRIIFKGLWKSLDVSHWQLIDILVEFAELIANDSISFQLRLGGRI